MRSLLITLLLSFSLFAHAGDEVFRIIDSNKEAAQARVDIVQQAQEELLVSYFIYNQDVTGLAGLTLLLDAARRGVDVKIIFDANFKDIDKGLLQFLIDEGVDIKLFHPHLFHLKRLEQRWKNYSEIRKQDDYDFGDLFKKRNL
jgi:phosphatidylserine/phosphatidylglycerophosphate/cardiolipin synthase-like enzyme